ncbi:MAG: hypothetical protein ACYTDT_03510 [Planctomycetota bacterium]|jgi:tetratricopeptide (TPR) repeat protein
MTHTAELAYLFRHAAMREGAYQLHVPSDRAELHEQALVILELMLPETELMAAAVDLAAHARLAQRDRTLINDELAQKELTYLKSAARHAKAMYQNAEAARYFGLAANHVSCRPVEGSKLLTTAAYLHWFAGERSACEDCFERALKLAGMDRAAQCDVLIERGTYFRDLGQYERGRDDLEQARKLAAQLEDKRLQLRAVGNLNTILDRDLSGREAEMLYEPLNDLARDLGNHAALGIAMGQVGHAYYAESSIQKAIEWLERSVEALQQANDGLNESVMLSTLASVILDQQTDDLRKEAHKASELFRRAVKRAKDVGNRPFSVSGYTGMAKCYRILGMSLEAETYARRGLSIAREIRSEGNLGLAYVELGHVLEERNANAEAERNYLHGLEIVQDFEDRTSAIRLLYSLARLAGKLDDWTAAEDYILTAADQPLDSTEAELAGRLKDAIEDIKQQRVPAE